VTKEQFISWLQAKLDRAEFDTDNDIDPGSAYWDAYYDALDSVLNAVVSLK
jgi:hypothetical protein